MQSSEIKAYPKADPAPALRARAPLFEIFWGFVFVNFDCITRNNINCCRHTMLTICTLFSTLTTKHRVCVKGASKETSDPKNSTATGPRPPPGFEIPGSATDTPLSLRSAHRL